MTGLLEAPAVWEVLEARAPRSWSVSPSPPSRCRTIITRRPKILSFWTPVSNLQIIIYIFKGNFKYIKQNIKNR